MRVLVVGGTSFIGRALVLRLLAGGSEVAVLNRGKTEDDLPAGVVRMVGDRDSLGDCRDAIERYAPSVVVHNVVANERQARVWLDACSGIDARLVMTSSCDVYAVYGRSNGSEEGPVDNTPQAEDSPLRTVLYPYRGEAEDESDPRWHYDKITAEQALLGAHDDACVLRLPMVLGPRDPQHRLRDLLSAMDRGRPHIVHDDGYANWQSTYGDVDNVAGAITAACSATELPSRTYNVGDEVLPIRALVDHVAAFADWRGRYLTPSRETLPDALVEPWDVRHWLVIDTDRIRDELGWAPEVGLRDTLERTLRWERGASEGAPILDPEREAAEDAWVKMHA